MKSTKLLFTKLLDSQTKERKCSNKARHLQSKVQLYVEISWSSSVLSDVATGMMEHAEQLTTRSSDERDPGYFNQCRPKYEQTNKGGEKINLHMAGKGNHILQQFSTIYTHIYFFCGNIIPTETTLAKRNGHLSTELNQQTWLRIIKHKFTVMSSCIKLVNFWLQR